MFNFIRKRAVVIGGNGALGTALVQKLQESWEVTSLDFTENKKAAVSIALAPSARLLDQALVCKEQLTGKYEAIFSVAGGFTTGSIAEDSIFEQIESSFEMNLSPALLAAHLATKFLSDEGILVLTGAAAPFIDTTPEELAYGLSKTAVHSLALNLATHKDLPSACVVAMVLPETIDTPANRRAMPEADYTKWTSPLGIAALLKMWAEGDNAPTNGSFAVLKLVNGQVIPEFV